MTLKLDHIQRLNLHTLLGTQRGDVAAIRALWAMQDRLALDSREEATIELKRDFVDGQERMIWNSTLSLPPKEFEFTDAEVSRLRAAVESWDSYGANQDRRWLQPLLEALCRTLT